MATTPATTVVHQVNLPFSYHYHQYRSKGTSLPHQLETRSPRTTSERSISFARKLEEEAQLVPFAFPYTYYNVYPKGRQAYSLLQTTMEPLPHGL